jgi:hypothetical protein
MHAGWVTTAFRIGRSDKELGKPQSLGGVLAGVRKRDAANPGERRSGLRGGPLKVSLTRSGFYFRLRRLLRGKPGRVVIFGFGEASWRIRIVSDSLPEADPGFPTAEGNDRIAYVCRVAAGFASDLQSLGGPVCKYISGTRTPSQHCKFRAPDPGCNAWDFALHKGGRYSVARVWELAHFLAANADELALAHLIHQDQIWTPTEGWHHYTGVPHHTHLHADCLPQRTASELACSPS